MTNPAVEESLPQKKISLSITTDQYEQMALIAKYRGTSASQIMRDSMSEYLGKSDIVRELTEFMDAEKRIQEFREAKNS